MRGAVGKHVRTLVEFVASVTFRPLPGEAARGRVPFHRRHQRLPEIAILDRLLGGGLPAVALPPLHPLRDPTAQVLIVGVDFDTTRAAERVERLDRRAQLHAVVGRLAGAPAEFLRVATVAQDRRPDSRRRCR